MGLFAIALLTLVHLGPVTLEKADRLDGVNDNKLTVENYVEALKPFEPVKSTDLNE